MGSVVVLSGRLQLLHQVVLQVLLMVEVVVIHLLWVVLAGLQLVLVLKRSVIVVVLIVIAHLSLVLLVRSVSHSF